MHIIDFLDKNEQIQVKMLSDILENGGTIDIKYLLKKYSLSYNTTITYLTNIIEYSKEFDDRVKWKMEQTEIRVITEFDFSIFELYNLYLQKSVNISLISEIAFFSDQTSLDLACKLNMSESSINRRIRGINRQLSSFGICIKANNFVGDEFKVRLFLFQLFSFTDLTANEKTNQLLQKALEEFLCLSDNDYLNNDLMNWLHICDKRRKSKSKLAFEYHILNEEKFKIRSDHFFKEINSVYTSYHKELNENESIYLYIFILIYVPIDINLVDYRHFITDSFSLNHRINQQTTELINILKNKDINKTLVDGCLDELHYELNRIHLLQSYTGGFCSLRDVVTKVKDYLIAENYSLDLLVNEMIAKLEELSNHTISESLKAIIYSRYTLLLYKLNFNQVQVIRIGIDVQSDIRIPTQLEVQTIEIPNSNVIIQSEEMEKEVFYDLIITDDFFDIKTFNGHNIYKLNGFKLEYDRIRIMEVLKEIHFKKIEETQLN